MLFVSVITKYPEIIIVNKLASAEIRKNFAIMTKLDRRIKKIINLPFKRKISNQFHGDGSKKISVESAVFFSLFFIF